VRFISLEHPDRSFTRRAASATLFAIALVANPLEAQQDSRFEVLTIPPANAGTCLPPLLKSPPGDNIQLGNRLVIRNPQPLMSREISTVTGRQGPSLVLSDRSQITTAQFRTTGAAITAMFAPNGTVSGFMIETTHSVPDSILLAQDLATIQKILDGGTGTSASRALDSTELSRARSMLEFIRKRCP
jgi:hypothetical protein